MNDVTTDATIGRTKTTDVIGHRIGTVAIGLVHGRHNIDETEMTTIIETDGAIVPVHRHEDLLRDAITIIETTIFQNAIVIEGTVKLLKKNASNVNVAQHHLSSKNNLYKKKSKKNNRIWL
jgi:hypothetical protein